MKTITVKDINHKVSKEVVTEVNILKEIKKLFPNSYPLPKPIRPSVTGVPDRIFCINGRFVAIEVKRKKMFKISDKQLEHQQKIIKAGGIAIITNDWEEAKEELLKCLK